MNNTDPTSPHPLYTWIPAIPYTSQVRSNALRCYWIDTTSFLDDVYITDASNAHHEEIVFSGTQDGMESSRMVGEAEARFPLEILDRVLLKLYEPPSYHEPWWVEIRHRTLLSCRLVCRRWSMIVQWSWDRFTIRASNKTWPCPSLSWYIIRGKPLILQECDPEWLLERYSTALIHPGPKFLPELLPNMVAGL